MSSRAVRTATGATNPPPATKRLARDVTILSILFWLTLMQFGLGLGIAALDGQVALPTAQTLPWLALIGVCGVLAHLCLTTALSLAPASLADPELSLKHLLRG